MARRSRLFRRLDAGGTGPIVVVAPAGFGKTSLIEHWVTTGGQPSQVWRPGQEVPVAGRLIVDDADQLTGAEAAQVVAAAGSDALTLVVLARAATDWIRGLVAAPRAVSVRSSHLRYREAELAALTHASRYGEDPDELMLRTGGIPALVAACLSADADEAVARAAAAVVASFSPPLHEPILKLAVNGATPLADLGQLLSLPPADAKEVEAKLRDEGAVITTLSGVVALEPGLAAPIDRWLRDREPERYARFHHEAADRLAAQGEPAEALRHAAAVGDAVATQDLLRRWWARLWVTDEQLVQLAVRRSVVDGPQEFPAGFSLLWRSAWQREGALVDDDIPDEAPKPDCEALRAAVRTLFGVRSGCRREDRAEVTSLIDRTSPTGALLACAIGLRDVVDGRVWEGVKVLDVALEIADRMGDRRLRDHAITLQALALVLVGDLAAGSQRLATLAPVVGRTPELRKLTTALVDLESGRIEQVAENLTPRVLRQVDSALRPVARHALWLRDVAQGRGDAVAENGFGRSHAGTSYIGALADGVVQLAANEAITAPSLPDPLTPESEWRLYLAARQLHDGGDHTGTLALLAPHLAAPSELTSRFRADLLLLAASAELADGDELRAVRSTERAIRRVAVSGVERSIALMPPRRLAALDRLLHQYGSSAASVEAWRRWVPGQQPALVSLTPRELGVLRYLASDATLPQIAEALYISRNTLKSHLRRIYRKLGADGRATAVAAARAQDLLQKQDGPEA